MKVSVPVGAVQSAFALGRHSSRARRQFKMKLQQILLLVLLYSSWSVNGLKCRSAAESQQNNDFEYVVRMCLRHLKNESDVFDFYRIQTDYDSAKSKKDRDDMSATNNNNNNNDNNNNNNNNENRNYYSRNRGFPEGFDRFWPPNNAPHDRNRYSDDDRNRQDGDYEESDYFGVPRSGKDGRKKFKVRPQMPHSYQQQLQHDRDVFYARGNRDSNYFYSNRNKNTKFMFNKEKNSDSPLADIDPCVIHCIFQEMQMVDDNGKPNKGMISQKMTQKIRNSELKNFIQESVDECFEAIDEEDFGPGSSWYNNNNNNRHRKPEMTCEWAKTFAMCLEDKGKQNCDDWNEPTQKNHSNSGGSNKNNEDQRHKSKQSDRG